ncbi:MAG: hypothetical protein EZS28_039416, partial [Streblomastix strix]
CEERERLSLVIRQKSCDCLNKIIFGCSVDGYDQLIQIQLSKILVIGLSIVSGFNQKNNDMIRNLLKCAGKFIKFLGQGFYNQFNGGELISRKEAQYQRFKTSEEEIEEEGGNEELNSHQYDKDEQVQNQAVIAMKDILNHFRDQTNETDELQDIWY